VVYTRDRYFKGSRFMCFNILDIPTDEVNINELSFASSHDRFFKYFPVCVSLYVKQRARGQISKSTRKWSKESSTSVLKFMSINSFSKIAL
jgi:hypothetical protein